MCKGILTINPDLLLPSAILKRYLHALLASESPQDLSNLSELKAGSFLEFGHCCSTSLAASEASYDLENLFLMTLCHQLFTSHDGLCPPLIPFLDPDLFPTEPPKDLAS